MAKISAAKASAAMKQLIALSLAVLLCFPTISIPTAEAAEPTASEPSYSVAYHGQSDAEGIVTFKITASVKPERDTDVYYRVWSGDSQGAVAAQTGFVTFNYDDFTESGKVRYVTVQVGAYDEGLSRYTAPSGSENNATPPTSI